MVRSQDPNEPHTSSGATIAKQCPDFRVMEIEGHLLYWIESGYNPEDHSPEPLAQEQLDELERLGLQWVDDHTRRAA